MLNPTRKVFNCIVDDSALASGLRKNTRDGIRKWVSAGAIRLFVPLHTLEQLKLLKNINGRIGSDAREAINWLDEITSLPNSGVYLQEPDQAYSTWEEVEDFMLPETLLSERHAEHDEPDVLAGDFEQSLGLHAAHEESDQASLNSSQSFERRPLTPCSPSSLSPGTSPRKLARSPKKAAVEGDRKNVSDYTARNSLDGVAVADVEENGAPRMLRPLFNHSVWLINQEPNSETALQNFILLTNDMKKQAVASKFGIRARRLEELRDIIGREDRDLKNRVQLFKKESKELYSPPGALLNRTPVGPKKSREFVQENVAGITTPKGNSRGSATSNGHMLDPNEFSRSPPPSSRSGGGRGGRTPVRGPPRGPFHASSLDRNSPRGLTPSPNPARPIDPDSFSRPTPAGRAMRGGRRRLWEPA
ncbi:hypothetical protein EJ05DRAFT_145367 [Pseudovirgaria hyperparasitica]|uniref:PIN domain-containing protein n=1 Tax=Pseudovirgaria hyperparasitica TaxID=470096 RepID=A0A6A6VVI5_9PEZI|nr:uncharacterized protein EJ05DRAFT_145367 [Pseudovirgaria hyperparasitica]KAF2754582.1 hypothetical protein EJ05DRAFT_145367 [Pseudovirgaria hyperparasitica]